MTPRGILTFPIFNISMNERLFIFWGVMRNGSQTRERIERTALKLFVENGVTETSIRDIAREAGVSQGAMYNHYASKEDLVWYLFSENFSDIGNELRHIASEEETLL